MSNDSHTEKCLQESPEKKALWLADAKVRIPEGTRVRVVNSDMREYIDATGHVCGYDVGTDGDWPLVCVMFDEPIDGHTRDAFYFDGYAADDEIEIIDTAK